jgi:hypothetical protein
MAQDSAFDVANQIRELAEKNIEQAHAAYGHYGRHSNRPRFPKR